MKNNHPNRNKAAHERKKRKVSENQVELNANYLERHNKKRFVAELFEHEKIACTDSGYDSPAIVRAGMNALGIIAKKPD